MSDELTSAGTRGPWNTSDSLRKVLVVAAAVAVLNVIYSQMWQNPTTPTPIQEGDDHG